MEFHAFDRFLTRTGCRQWKRTASYRFKLERWSAASLSRGQFHHPAQGLLSGLAPFPVSRSLASHISGKKGLIEEVLYNILHRRDADGRIERHRVLVASARVFHSEMELPVMDQETEEAGVFEIAATIQNQKSETVSRIRGRGLQGHRSDPPCIQGLPRLPKERPHFFPEKLFRRQCAGHSGQWPAPEVRAAVHGI